MTGDAIECGVDERRMGGGNRSNFIYEGADVDVGVFFGRRWLCRTSSP